MQVRKVSKAMERLNERVDLSRLLERIINHRKIKFLFLLILEDTEASTEATQSETQPLHTGTSTLWLLIMGFFICGKREKTFRMSCSLCCGRCPSQESRDLFVTLVSTPLEHNCFSSGVLFRDPQSEYSVYLYLTSGDHKHAL